MILHIFMKYKYLVKTLEIKIIVVCTRKFQWEYVKELDKSDFNLLSLWKTYHI